MKKNNWLLYFIYVIVLICYIIFSNNLLILVSKQREMTYTILPSILWSMIIFIALGGLLGLEKLIFEMQKEGKWRINLPKIIFLGVPSLYFSLGILTYFCSAGFIQQTLSYPIQFFVKGDANFLSVFQMIFGYTISTSFIKEEN